MAIIIVVYRSLISQQGTCEDDPLSFFADQFIKLGEMLEENPERHEYMDVTFHDSRISVENSYRPVAQGYLFKDWAIYSKR